jgi:hypothetical protein
LSALLSRCARPCCHGTHVPSCHSAVLLSRSYLSALRRNNSNRCGLPPGLNQVANRCACSESSGPVKFKLWPLEFDSDHRVARLQLELDPGAVRVGPAAPERPLPRQRRDFAGPYHGLPGGAAGTRRPWRPGLSESGLSESGLSESGLSESGLSESGLSESGLSESGLSESGLS